jgi:hypothetical protein
VRLKLCLTKPETGKEGYLSESRTFKTVCKSGQDKNDGEDGVRWMTGGDDVGNDFA